ncbi:excisionase family DNA-binding protein [bacterium]|nr:excisionase family DNA-binding protein [bacterium]
MAQSDRSPENRWLSVDEISAYLGVKRDTVYNWISEKRMPAHRMGRLWKFRMGEVDDWVRLGGPAKWDRAPRLQTGNGLPEPDSTEEAAKPKKMKVNEKDLQVLEKFKSLLQGEVKLHQVILFGSRARGNASGESDMDVLIVVDEPVTQELRNRVSGYAWKAGFDEGVVLGCVLYTREEWENSPERYSPFVETVRSEGILL